MWADDDRLKKCSGKTLEENKEEEGSEPPKVETQEVRSKACPSPGGAGTRVPLQILLPAGLAAPGLRDGKTELYFPVSFIPCKPVRERETAGLGQPRVSSADPAPGKRSRGGAGFTNSL